MAGLLSQKHGDRLLRQGYGEPWSAVPIEKCQSVLLHGRIDFVRPGVDATCEIERAFVTVVL